MTTAPRDAERQLSDRDLIKKIFLIYDSIHPNSISSMRWVMGRHMFDRLGATTPVGPGWALTIEISNDVQKWSWTEPLMILGLPVRVAEAGPAQYQPIQIEVCR